MKKKVIGYVSSIQIISTEFYHKINFERALKLKTTKPIPNLSAVWNALSINSNDLLGVLKYYLVNTLKEIESLVEDMNEKPTFLSIFSMAHSTTTVKHFLHSRNSQIEYLTIGNISMSMSAFLKIFLNVFL